MMLCDFRVEPIPSPLGRRDSFPTPPSLPLPTPINSLPPPHWPGIVAHTLFPHYPPLFSVMVTIQW